MNIPRIVIAGTHSGAGKTTVTVGVIAALRRRGLVVQPFKAGPDYIDPAFHTAAAGRVSRCLDTWMMDGGALLDVLRRGSRYSDISIVEGVMGLYDGKEPTGLTGSTAELSISLLAPVLLVLDAAAMARSAAAVVLGFQMLEPKVRIAGVIVNRVGSVGHFRLLKESIESACGIPVLGYLVRSDADFNLPERHLGLVPAAETEALQEKVDRIAAAVEETFDLESIVKLARQAPELQFEGAAEPEPAEEEQPTHVASIAVAKDEAFHFYYQDNLELLERHGARLLYFSPLRGETVPEEADGLYIGGGFPEQFAAELSSRGEVLAGLRKRIEEGLPTLAECGGYMLLSKSIMTLDGTEHPMAGVIPGFVKMQPKLAALGYREVRALTDNPILAAGERARGHEFHYSTIEYEPAVTIEHAYEYQNMKGIEPRPEGYANPSLAAGYTHLHFASNPGMARRFVAACSTYRGKRSNERRHSK